jgi:hypothetical protein
LRLAALPLSSYLRRIRFSIAREAFVNKPVILAEDTLVAPIVVDGAAPPKTV